MAEQTIHHLMVFPNKAALIYPFVQKVMAFVEQHIPEKAAQIAFNTRIIVTELLTNSIKHTIPSSPIGFELFISPQSFIIKKIDEGEPLNFKACGGQWPLPNPVDSTFAIYADALNGLFAKVTSPYNLSFYTESYPEPDDALTGMSEHYGLMIISRASADFVYQYNPRSGQNIFTVTIALDD